MNEKPSKVEVGQRFIDRGTGREFTVTAVSGNLLTARYSNGEQRRLTPDGVLKHCTYLGGPEPVKPPAPAKGQRWLHVATGDVVTLAGFDGKYWDAGRRKGDGWYPSRFTDGEFVFVDHGEPASSASQPRTGPKCRPGIEKNYGPCTPGTSYETCSRVSSNGTPSRLVRCACECHPENARFAAKLPPPATLTARMILQSRERARQAKREEDARAVAAFVSDWDLLPDARPQRRAP